MLFAEGVGLLGSAMSSGSGESSGSGNGGGGLVGTNNLGTIQDNSYAVIASSGIIYGRYVGGLVGQNASTGTIDNSYHATGAVTGSNYVGGLVGTNHGSVSNSHATGIIVFDNYCCRFFKFPEQAGSGIDIKVIIV